MKRKIFYTLIITLALINADVIKTLAQGAPQAFNYQAIAHDAFNLPVANQLIGIKIGIYANSSAGTLVWEETHQITSNQFGLFSLTIGQGSSTGNGSAPSFSAIAWGAAAHYLKVSMDITGGTNYQVMDNSQLLSVPYALYSQNAGAVDAISLNDLMDADTAGVAVGKTLKWNGLNWVSDNDNNSDTALYAYNAYNSLHADTALYTLHATPADTANFAFTANNATFADSAGWAVTANHSIYSDTAAFALNCGNTSNDWHLGGNAGTAASNYLGTSDSVDLIFKTKNIERMRISAIGRVGIGTALPVATMHILGNNGLVAQGTFGAGSIAPPVSGAGTRMMWYPRRAAFRVGTVTSNAFDSLFIGNYSFASGYDSKARGHYSVAMGQICQANDTGAVAMGYLAIANQKFAVAIGNAPNATGVSSVAIGRNPTASGFASVAIGYHPVASGNFSTSLGDHCVASGANSTAVGCFSHTNGFSGSFIFADLSTPTAYTYSTAANQFMVKATGGTYFYTDAALSAGVYLLAGGGSWNQLSDKRKKANFKAVDGSEILNKIADMELTSWNYKTQSPKIRHIGPMAQDFYAAFGFGESDTTITSVDIDGINMVAIKALIEKTNELKKKSGEIAELKATIEVLKKNNSELEMRIDAMESTISKKFKLYSQVPADTKAGGIR